MLISFFFFSSRIYWTKWSGKRCYTEVPFIKKIKTSSFWTFTAGCYQGDAPRTPWDAEWKLKTVLYENQMLPADQEGKQLSLMFTFLDVPPTMVSIRTMVPMYTNKLSSHTIYTDIS